ncbi:hypothetical protein [Bradyrhizobium sp. RT6a]|uniref:hypothetical protein n=1 Tax=unclassified Bradyrhizobium TaxID=2631580 RepID=UPI003393FD4D
MTDLDHDAHASCYHEANDLEAQNIERHEREDESCKKWKFVSGAVAIKDRYGNTVDDYTVAPKMREPNTFGFDNTDEEIKQDEARSNLPRLEATAVAKRGTKERLAKARQEFDMSVLKENKKPKAAIVPANDNEPAPNWLVLEAINRIKDSAERVRRKDTALYLRELVDTAGADALGLSVHRPGKAASVDYDVDRSSSGKLIFHNGQTLDRKWREYSEKNGEPDAKRYDGSLRTSKRSAPVSGGFDVVRDDPAAQRRLDAQMELEDLAAVVGPLWLPLMDAVCNNSGFTEIAARLGYSQPVVGSCIVMLALEVAAKHIEAYHDAKDFRDFVDTHGLPVTARRYMRAIADGGTLRLAA